MVFEAIDRLKTDLTDKYVIVTGDRPELSRFEGVVGQVKTVNMSGRALVEFTGYHNNPGWHDIDPVCLRIVDRPVDPPATKAAARPASKVPAKAAGKSAADVLAAVRGGSKAAGKPDAAGRAVKRTSPSVGKSTADILAAARGASAEENPAGKKTSPSVGLSTADVLAAARGKKAAPAAAPATSAKPKPEASKSSGMTTKEILAAARAAKKPPVETAKTSAIDELVAQSTGQPAGRKRLTAADIRDIGLGKLSIRREPHVATAPMTEKSIAPADEDSRPAALPKPSGRPMLNAAQIRDLGAGKRG